MTLLSIDEARRMVIASAGAVLAYAACPDNGRLVGVLWGRDDFGGQGLADQALALAHRRVLAQIDAQGNSGIMAEELEGTVLQRGSRTAGGTTTSSSTSWAMSRSTSPASRRSGRGRSRPEPLVA